MGCAEVGGGGKDGWVGEQLRSTAAARRDELVRRRPHSNRVAAGQASMSVPLCAGIEENLQAVQPVVLRGCCCGDEGYASTHVYKEVGEKGREEERGRVDGRRGKGECESGEERGDW